MDAVVVAPNLVLPVAQDHSQDVSRAVLIRSAEPVRTVGRNLYGSSLRNSQSCRVGRESCVAVSWTVLMRVVRARMLMQYKQVPRIDTDRFAGSHAGEDLTSSLSVPPDPFAF